ncbi:MAG TPA: hypothetical protein VFS44_14005 [Gemmatimonadaceae bacterium]|nr:hypothetical protein [Gemmatimonadaceae bacterium]
MRILGRFGVVAAVILTGCKLSSDLPTHVPAGIINATTVSDGSDGFTTSPVGIFYNNVNVTPPSDSRLAPDSCVDTTFVAPTNPGSPNVTNVDAGASIAVQTDLATGSMTPDTDEFGLISYVIPNSGSVPLSAGSTVTFVVPGAENGFAAMTITAPTVHPYTLGPIDTMPADSMLITWTPADGAPAAMDLSFQYALDSNRTTPNRQIACRFVDDGSGYIKKQFAAHWRQAAPGTRHIDSQRWRTTQQTIDFNSLVVQSRFNVSKTTFP